MQKDNTYTFIDAANIFYTSKTLKYKIDFEKFFLYLKKLGSKKVFYYTGYDPNNQKQLKFLNKLTKIGFRIKQKPIKIIKNKQKRINKANVDVEMAIDVMNHVNRLKKVILVTGDSDFAYLILH